LSSLTKGLILLLVILGIGVGLVVWKNKVGGHTAVNFNSISQDELQTLLADVAKSDPIALKRLAEDQEEKKRQLDSLKQILAFASEAQRTGVASEKPHKQELENIAAEVVAVNYDRDLNKDKGPMPPFGFIGEDRVKQFWGEGEQPADQGWFANFKNKIGLGREDHNLGFDKFIETKLQILGESNPKMKDHQLTDDERQQARDFYAKIAIYNDEYHDKLAKGEIAPELQKKVELQMKLQQAQYLARIYSAKMAEQLKVTDEEVAKYIADHPELGIADKKAKAEEILNRAKSGEDFAKLADEFSDDPGNNGPEGKKQGGFYGNNTKGKMVPAFEEAALALEPGQVTPNLVETDYGYHIIKLEKKGPSEDPNLKGQEVYDVRHILISTGVKDPESPFGGEKPVKMYVKQKLEAEKEKAKLDEIVAKNHVTVPEDFVIPEVTDEQIQEAMKKRQQQMPNFEAPEAGEGEDGETPPNANANTGTTGKKPAPAKKGR
jgi:parvulin-like peptidyl-prolyl isomerase